MKYMNLSYNAITRNYRLTDSPESTIRVLNDNSELASLLEVLRPIAKERKFTLVLEDLDAEMCQRVQKELDSKKVSYTYNHSRPQEPHKR